MEGSDEYGLVNCSNCPKCSPSPPPPPSPTPPPSVDCVGNWNPLTCQADCSDLVYRITTPASGGGKECDNATDDTKKCNPGDGACPPSPPPSPTPSSSHTIQFINSSNKNIYIVFTKGGNNDFPTIRESWKFYNNNAPDISNNQINSIPGTPFYAKLWFGPILQNSIFTINYEGSSDTPIWESGKCSISPIRPPDGFDDGNLTSMEWTFNPEGSFSPDLSALDGINIKVDMRVVNGNSCDSEIKTCKIDFNDQKNSQFLKSRTYEGQTIKSISRPDFVPSEDFIYAGTDGINGLRSKCGKTNDPNNENCITCPFEDGDYCRQLEPLSDVCYAKDITARWGCYKWWANPTNIKATEWLDIYTSGEGCHNSYKWVFDETGIFKKDPNEATLNTLNETFWGNDQIYDGINWSDSDKYVCALADSDTMDESMKTKCDGYPVKKGSTEGPNINCGPSNKDTQLIYTIYDILT